MAVQFRSMAEFSESGSVSLKEKKGTDGKDCFLLAGQSHGRLQATFENMQAAQVPQEQEMTSRSRTLSFRILMQPKSLSGSFKLIGTNHHESLIYHTDT